MSSKFISRGADNYDRYMGRWSRRLAPLFLDFAGVGDGERVLEVGCGTGSLTFTLAQHANFARLDAIDYTAEFVEAARAHNTDPRIDIRQGDACSLPFADAAFDRALSLLVLHFVSEPGKAVAEMRRVLRPGGVAAAAVWDNYGGMPSVRMFWDSVAAVEPRARKERDAAGIRPMTRPGELRDAFVNGGFRDVAETMLTIRMEFASFEDYWVPTVTGQGGRSEFLTALSEAERQRVEATVRAAYLCGLPDGPRSFASVAWAVRGVVPQS